VLRAFSLVGGVFFGAILSITALLARMPVPAVWGALAACAAAYVGWSRPYAFMPAYGMWNRAAANARRLARAGLAAICFLVFTVVSASGERVRWRPSEATESGWFPRRTPRVVDLASPADIPLPTAGQHGWLVTLTSWARETGSLWIWPIVPLLALLRAIEPDQELDVGHTSYTLY
jgi:hypothetical protein